MRYDIPSNYPAVMAVDPRKREIREYDPRAKYALFGKDTKGWPRCNSRP